MLGACKISFTETMTLDGCSRSPEVKIGTVSLVLRTQEYYAYWSYATGRLLVICIPIIMFQMISESRSFVQLVSFLHVTSSMQTVPLDTVCNSAVIAQNYAYNVRCISVSSYVFQTTQSCVLSCYTKIVSAPYQQLLKQSFFEQVILYYHFWTPPLYTIPLLSLIHIWRCRRRG